MTTVRNGHWATLDGQVLPVRWVKGDRWRVVRTDGDAGTPPGPADDHGFADFDEVVRITTVGSVAGVEFEVTSAPGEEVDIYATTVPEEVRRRLSLRGDPYSGWTARVPAASVADLREVVHPGQSTTGGPR